MFDKIRTNLSGIKGTVDTPYPNMAVSVPTVIDVAGWAFSKQSNIKQVQVFQAGQYLGDLSHGQSRPDVAAHLGIAAAEKSGFSGSVLLQNAQPLTVKITSSDGRIRQITRQLKQQSSTQSVHLQQPTANMTYTQGTLLSVVGDVSAKPERLRLFIDHVLFKEWDPETASFHMHVPLVDLLPGDHHILVEAHMPDGSQAAVVQQFKVQSSKIKMQVETLRDVSEQQVFVQGWAFSYAAKIEYITAYIVGQSTAHTLKQHLPRLDISRQYGHPRALMCGFEGMVDVADLINYTLIVRVQDKAGFTLEQTRYVGEEASKSQTAKPEFMLSIDMPQDNTAWVVGQQLSLDGWALSDAAPIAQITILLDDKVVGKADWGVVREDVADYLGDPQKSFCGFHGDIDTNNWQPGEHMLQVRAVDMQGNMMTKSIIILLHERMALDIEHVIWQDEQLKVAGQVTSVTQVDDLMAHFFVDGDLIGQKTPSIDDDIIKFDYAGQLAPPAQSLRVEIRHADSVLVHQVYALRHIGQQAPNALSNRWYLLAQCAEHTQGTLNVLNWTENDYRDPMHTVFTLPPYIGEQLPYWKDSISVVVIDDESRMDEAFRVAEIAVIHGEEIIWKVSSSSAQTYTVSIIIPVYGELHYTKACLEQLQATLPDDLTYEVIVVDDASTDKTPDYLATLSEQWAQLNVLTNEGNLGFIGSCNRAATAAQYDYLVFLNNDTSPHVGWLAALMQTFEAYDNVGAVGGKLIYPDGTLQEAGCVVFDNGNAWNIGRGDSHINHPLYQHVRPVDYCSGALLATPRAFFQQLGGFDTLYKPAYYEDTDYCFKVRQAGYSVYYQPDSVVTHFEGRTSNQHGVKVYQRVNHQKFIDKWDLQQQHTLPADAPTRQNLFKVILPPGKKHVLIASPLMPEFDREGGSRRIYHFILMMQRAGWVVTFLARDMAKDRRYIRVLQQMGVMVYIQSPDAEAAYVPDIAHLLENANFDLAIIAFWYYAQPLINFIRAHSPHTKIIVESIDLHFLRYARETFYTTTDNFLDVKYGDQMRREINCYADADAVLTVSQKEADLINDLLAQPQHAFSVVDMKKPLSAQHPFEDRQGMVFIGNFKHPPNRDAVLHLLDDIVPLLPEAVLQENPIYIIGNALDEALYALIADIPHVHAIGWVPVLQTYLSRTRITLAPMRYGAGTKRKVIDALMAGTPTIGTTIAAEGFNVEHGVHMLICDNPEAFAQAVIQLLDDRALWEKLSINGRQHMLQTHDADEAFERLMAVIDYVNDKDKHDD